MGGGESKQKESLVEEINLEKDIQAEDLVGAAPRSSVDSDVASSKDEYEEKQLRFNKANVHYMRNDSVTSILSSDLDSSMTLPKNEDNEEELKAPEFQKGANKHAFTTVSNNIVPEIPAKAKPRGPTPYPRDIVSISSEADSTALTSTPGMVRTNSGI